MKRRRIKITYLFGKKTTYLFQVRIQHGIFVGCAVAGGWKSKTQRGNFSTTYPALLTPVKKIYFKVEFFAKFRKKGADRIWTAPR